MLSNCFDGGCFFVTKILISRPETLALDRDSEMLRLLLYTEPNSEKIKSCFYRFVP